MRWDIRRHGLSSISPAPPSENPLALILLLVTANTDVGNLDLLLRLMFPLLKVRSDAPTGRHGGLCLGERLRRSDRSQKESHCKRQRYARQTDISGDAMGDLPLAVNLAPRAARRNNVQDMIGTPRRSRVSGSYEGRTMLLSKRLATSPGLLASSLANRVRVDSLLRNSIYVMGTTVVTAASGYLFWLIAAHAYPADDVGLASALIGTMMLASAVVSFGTVPMLIQVLPRRETGYQWSLTLNAVLGAGIVGSLLTGIIAAALLPQLSPKLIPIGHEAAYTITLISGVPLVTLVDLLSATFVAERAAGSALVQTAVLGALRIPFLMLPVLLRLTGALMICASWNLAAGTGVIGGALLVSRLRRSYRLAIRGIWTQVRSVLSSLAGQQLISLGALLPTYLLPVIVTARLSPTENAYFYTTWRVGSLFFVVSSSVGVALFAEGSYEPSSIAHKARNSVLIIGSLLVPASLVAVLGGHLILSTFGPLYALNGYLLLMILVASAAPDAISNVYVAVLRVQRRLRGAALLNLGMAALTLILAWVLLPSLGIAGAGWAWLIAQIAGSAVVGFHLMAAGIHWKGESRRGL